LTSALAVCCAVVLGGSAAGCFGGETTGRFVTLDATIAPSPATKQSFTNAKGFDVTITRALVSTGAMYFYEGEPTLAAARPRPFRVFDLLVRPAFAHPGHFTSGDIRGEILAPATTDLRTGGTLGTGRGIAGVVRSATFSYRTPSAGTLAAELEGHVAIVEGTVTKDGQARAFRAEVDAADLVNEAGKLEIVGCPVDEIEAHSDAAVTLTVAVDAWLDQVDFDAVPDPNEPVLPMGSLARNELVRGMKAAAPYRFSYAPR
jgi:hypothetical protein